MCKYADDKNIKVIHQNKVVKVDACIAPLVYLLNEYGIETIACCCGHGNSKRSAIRISSQNIKLIPMEDGFFVHLDFPYQGKHRKQKMRLRKRLPMKAPDSWVRIDL